MTDISRTQAWLVSLRPKTLPLAFAAIIVGTTLAWWQGHFDPLVAGLALVTAGLLQILSNLANDYGDAVKGSDKPDRIGPLRGMQKGVITQAQMKRALIITVVLICLSGLALVTVASKTTSDFIGFLVLGLLGHKLIGLPAPVGMLFMAVLVKLCNGASPRLLEGSQVVYKFFQTSVTYPILFAVGVAITPWHELVAAFTVSNLLVIVSTVSALVATGFFVGKKIGMHPIDVAIVSCCQSGQGGTGDVAILTAGNRMSLMPFAQIATRIGGAINVSVSLLILGNFLV